MKINKHIFVNDKCIICGALSFPKLQQRYRDNNQTPPTTDERTCRDREDGVNVRDLRPEPTARSIAAEDSDTISRRIAEIEKERLEAINKSEPAQVAAPIEQEYDSLYGLYWLAEAKIEFKHKCKDVAKTLRDAERMWSYWHSQSKVHLLSEKNIG